LYGGIESFTYFNHTHKFNVLLLPTDFKTEAVHCRGQGQGQWTSRPRPMPRPQNFVLELSSRSRPVLEDPIPGNSVLARSGNGRTERWKLGKYTDNLRSSLFGAKLTKWSERNLTLFSKVVMLVIKNLKYGSWWYLPRKLCYRKGDRAMRPIYGLLHPNFIHAYVQYTLRGIDSVWTIVKLLLNAGSQIDGGVLKQHSSTSHTLVYRYVIATETLVLTHMIILCLFS